MKKYLLISLAIMVLVFGIGFGSYYGVKTYRNRHSQSSVSSSKNPVYEEKIYVSDLGFSFKYSNFFEFHDLYKNPETNYPAYEYRSKVPTLSYSQYNIADLDAEFNPQLEPNYYSKDRDNIFSGGKGLVDHWSNTVDAQIVRDMAFKDEISPGSFDSTVELSRTLTIYKGDKVIIISTHLPAEMALSSMPEYITTNLSWKDNAPEPGFINRIVNHNGLGAAQIWYNNFDSLVSSIAAN